MQRSLAGRVALPGHLARPRLALRGPRGLLRLGWESRRARIALVCAALGAALLLGGWLWFRGSSFVAVQRVSVSGARGPQAADIEAALRSAGLRMSTLQVNPAALRAAVAAFPVVRELRASTSFPHTLNVRVIEEPPVAVLLAGGARTAVAADGVVLGPALLTADLPSVSASFATATGQRVGEPAAREALRVLGAAPHALARLLARAFTAKEGLTLAMRNGLLVLFGNASRAHAKWRALETVLTDEGSAGASYVDVRVPERPAAGGFPAGAPPLAAATGAGAGAAASGAGSSVEAIAEALRSNAGVSTGAPSTGTTEKSEEHQPTTAGGASAASGGEATSAGASSGGEEAAAPPAAPGEAARASGGAGAPEAGG